RQGHDLAFEPAHGFQVAAGTPEHLVVDAGYQFEQRKVFGQGFLGFAGTGVIAAVAFERALQFLVAFFQLGETLGGQHRVQPAFFFFLVVGARGVGFGAGGGRGRGRGVGAGVGFALVAGVRFHVIVAGRFFLFLLVEAWFLVGVGGGGAVVVRVQVAGNDVG